MASDHHVERVYGENVRRAARDGKLAVVNELLSMRADVNHQSALGGYTPLIEAIDNSRAEIVFALLDARADANAQDHRGLSPLHWLRNAHSLESEALTEVCRRLLDACAQPNLPTKHGQLPSEFVAAINSPKHADLVTLMQSAERDLVLTLHLPSTSDLGDTPFSVRATTVAGNEVTSLHFEDLTEYQSLVVGNLRTQLASAVGHSVFTVKLVLPDGRLLGDDLDAQLVRTFVQVA